MIKSRETDLNSDGINDELLMEINLKISEDALISIHGVNLFLMFDYKLYSYSTVELEGLIYFHYNSYTAGSRLEIMGDLNLIQRQPPFLAMEEIIDLIKEYSDYNELINNNFNLKKILSDYFSRNLSTILTNTYSIWTPGPLLNDPFVIHIHIKYPEQLIIYKPGFWEVIKWSWMQYLSLLIITILLARKIKSYVFKNHLVFSIKETPWVKKIIRILCIKTR